MTAASASLLRVLAIPLPVSLQIGWRTVVDCSKSLDPGALLGVPARRMTPQEVALHVPGIFFGEAGFAAVAVVSERALVGPLATSHAVEVGHGADGAVLIFGNDLENGVVEIIQGSGVAFRKASTPFLPGMLREVFFTVPQALVEAGI